MAKHCFGCGEIRKSGKGKVEVFSDGYCQKCIMKVFKFLLRNGMMEIIDKAIN